MRLLVLALLSFVLASCWTGVDLYSASDARQVLSPGAYRVTPPNEPPKTYRVTRLASGMTEFDDGDEKDVYGLAPLAEEANLFVAWMQPGGAAEKANGQDRSQQMYLLLVREAPGRFLVYLPECKDLAREIATRAGATVDGGQCRFATRAGLESALRLLPRDGRSAIKLERI